MCVDDCISFDSITLYDAQEGIDRMVSGCK